MRVHTDDTDYELHSELSQLEVLMIHTIYKSVPNVALCVSNYCIKLMTVFPTIQLFKAVIGTHLNALAKTIASAELPHQSNAQWYFSVLFVVLSAALCPWKTNSSYASGL